MSAYRASASPSARGTRRGSTASWVTKARAGTVAGRPIGSLTGLRRRSSRRPRLPAAYVPADPGEDEFLVVQAEPAVEVVRVDLAQAVVLDPGDKPGRGVQRAHPALGGA